MSASGGSSVLDEDAAKVTELLLCAPTSEAQTLSAVRAAALWPSPALLPAAPLRADLLADGLPCDCCLVAGTSPLWQHRSWTVADSSNPGAIDDARSDDGKLSDAIILRGHTNFQQKPGYQGGTRAMQTQWT